MPLILVLFLATLASAYVCFTIAKERHADARFWSGWVFYLGL